MCPERGGGVTTQVTMNISRTAVRNLERAGVSRSVSMKLTGHKTERVYRRYAIVAEADLRGGVAKLTALQRREGRIGAHRAQEQG